MKQILKKNDLLQHINIKVFGVTLLKEPPKNVKWRFRFKKNLFKCSLRRATTSTDIVQDFCQTELTLS